MISYVNRPRRYLLQAPSARHQSPVATACNCLQPYATPCNINSKITKTNPPIPLHASKTRFSKIESHRLRITRFVSLAPSPSPSSNSPIHFAPTPNPTTSYDTHVKIGKEISTHSRYSKCRMLSILTFDTRISGAWTLPMLMWM